MRAQSAQQYRGFDRGGADAGGQDSAFREPRGDRLDAQRGGSARQTGGVGMLLRHAEDFNLTEDQQDRLEKLRLDHELEKVDLRAAVAKAKIRLRALARDYDAPEAAIVAAIDELSACEANLRKMRYRHVRAARSILSKDQVGNLRVYHKQHLRDKIKAFNAAKEGS